MSLRVILITGANGGLGRGIGRAFLEEAESNFVCLGVRASRDHATKLVQQFPTRCELVDLEVTEPESWKTAVAQIIQTHQRLDVLVNNAGKHEDHLLAMMPSQAWEEVVRTNLDGTFHGCQAVLPAMIAQRGGRIINIASLSALLVPPGQANYAAAKAGVVALTQSLAKEVARMQITVNVLCPGFIETELLSKLTPDERKTAANRIPMRRFGSPAEVAAAVLFLACSQASYITGSVLKVDGGIF